MNEPAAPMTGTPVTIRARKFPEGQQREGDTMVNGEATPLTAGTSNDDVAIPSTGDGWLDVA